MKILISADMEGVCGVTSWAQVTPVEYGGRASGEYERARLQMTREVAAAAQGALAAGASEVIVADSHHGMRNILGELLPSGTRLVSGNERPLGMMQGVDEQGVTAAFFVGYHARAGTPRAVLAHTWNGLVQDVRLNGRSTGEFGLNAWIAAHFRVPVALVTGDDIAVAQVRAELGEHVEGVSVKTSLSRYAATNLHPGDACERIEIAARIATGHAPTLPAYEVNAPTRVEIDLAGSARLDLVTHLLPNVERLGNFTVAYTAADALDGFRMFRLVNKLAEVDQDF
ncbi:M55 family metallopeptidase [Deinococcus yavapaiensis]|uniref:D-aminopeptidase DppA n=1 Tax=Deinococcus yavapaiensis KR-236 TaxID=694435 RepID=A0A318S8E4_9DEIO|nr:M55 family metallopeptidase [Deinococcus yavapaiensis]PYE55326.1 D-aminopeptidase DppA [Deinococcus yavapaiensis KR-236]